MNLIKGIHHVSMKAAAGEEYNKTVVFYKDVLGLTVVRQWDGGIMLDTGSGLIEIFNNAGEHLDKGIIRHFAFAVSDVDECVKSVTEAGYRIFLGPKDIEIPSACPLNARIAFCYGPLGEEIEFFCEY